MPVIVLLTIHLSLNVKETADHIWDIVRHGFSNIPQFSYKWISAFCIYFIEDLGFFFIIIQLVFTIYLFTDYINQRKGTYSGSKEDSGSTNS